MDREQCWLSSISDEATSPTDSHSHSINYDLESWVGAETNLRLTHASRFLVIVIYLQVNITLWTRYKLYCLGWTAVNSFLCCVFTLRYYLLWCLTSSFRPSFTAHYCSIQQSEDKPVWLLQFANSWDASPCQVLLFHSWSKDVTGWAPHEYFRYCNLLIAPFYLSII